MKNPHVVHLVRPNTFCLKSNEEFSVPDARWRMLIDSPSCGPSRYLPEEHRRTRLEYWNALDERMGYSREGMYKNLFDGEALISSLTDSDGIPETLVLWHRAGLNEDLKLWWVCDACERFCSQPVKLHLVAPPEKSISFAEFQGLFDNPPQNLLTEEERHAAAELWRLFCEGDIPALVAAQENQPELLAETVASLLDYFREHATRLQNGKLMLSLFDQTLLQFAGRKRWKTAAVFVGHIDWLFKMGSHVVADRIFQIASRGPFPLLERRTLPPAKNKGILGLNEFRLTEAGRMALENGITDPHSVPVMEAGGATFSSTPGSWAYQVDGDRFVRI